MGESALSLVARSVTRPSLFQNYSIFQEDGLRNKEIVEVSGEAGSGKTLILLDLIKKCILPKELDGFEAEVIYIDTSCQFSIFQLVSMLEYEVLEKDPSESLKSNPNELKSLIETFLNRLTIFTCSDLETLFLQFHYFKTFLIGNSNVSVIMLDSISEFYWSHIQCSKELRKMDTFVSKVLNYFHSQLSSFNISLIYTRPSYFFSHNTVQSECSSVFNLKNVNTLANLSISKREDTVLYSVDVTKSDTSFTKTFKILQDGRISML